MRSTDSDRRGWRHRREVNPALGRLRELFRVGRDGSLARPTKELRLKPIGWVSYFRKSGARIAFEELDPWIRRKLRVDLWRQWKRPKKPAPAICPGAAWLPTEPGPRRCAAAALGRTLARATRAKPSPRVLYANVDSPA